MKRIVMQVVGFLILVIMTNGFSCARSSLFGCKTPPVKEAEYDNTHKSTLLGESKKCYMNFLEAQREIRELRSSNEVCK